MIALALAGPVWAQADAVRDYDVPAGDLAQVVNGISQQSGVQVIYDIELLRGKRIGVMKGQLSLRQALDKALAGTGLTYKFVNDTTVVIQRGESKPAESRPVPKPQPQATAEGEPKQLRAVEVIGSRLSSPSYERAQPIRIVEREEIERSGAGSIAQVLNNLPEVSIQSTTSPFQNGRGVSTVQLRGLPSGTALVLLNGRRLAGTPFQSSSGIVNLNILPLAAVDRIEVLPSGASAIYGGDALAGVVNIVLKKDFDGTEINARYGGADGYDERDANIGWGWTSDRASLSFIASFANNNELQGTERAITANNDYTRFGGHNASVTVTNPGNVYSVDGSNLPGLDAPFAGMPFGSDGIGLTPEDFEATAGVLHTDSTAWGQASQRPVTKQYSALLYGTYRLPSDVELFTELMFTHYESEERDYVRRISRAWTVPASNPFNPFGVDVNVDYLFKGAGRWCYCLDQDYYRVATGARGSLGKWEWELAGSWTRGDDTTNEGPLFDPFIGGSTEALADPNPATSLNVFADRTWTLEELSKYGLYTGRTELRSELQSLSGSFRGPLFDLGAGPVEASAGFEVERSTLDYDYYLTSFKGDRDNYAVFGEVRAPLVGPGAEGDAERLVLTGAARYDNYSDFGSKISPQVGIEWRPTKSLLLRAAYSAAYKPPTLYNLFSPVVTYGGFTITDPKRGGETYGTTVFQGGNPDLDPLTGHSTSAGIVFAPTSLPGLELSVTHWTAKIENYATFLSQAAIINDEALSARYITRAAPTPEDIANGFPGRITAFRSLVLNFGTFDLAGVDAAVRWRIATQAGEIVPSVSVSNSYKYETALTPGAPVQDRAGKATAPFWAPEWKGVVGLAWNTPLVQTTLTGRYVGQYEDYAPSTRSLGAYWFLDANLRYEVGRALWSGSPWLEQSYVSIGAVNLFNRLPEYSYYQGTVGYDPTQADIRGRFLYVQIGTRF